MWKSVAEMLSKFATLMYRVDRQEQAIKDLQQEIKTISAALERLMYEIHRGQERERHEREKFQLRIENELLKAGRQLPPKTEEPEA